MSDGETSAGGLNVDFLDMLQELQDASVDYIIVGAHAMAVHGVPRATGDLDILVRPTLENAQRVMNALRAFGAPVDAHGLTVEDLSTEGTVYQIGLPPRRIDIMTHISGVGFDEAWEGRELHAISALVLPFIGREELVRNKRATGRLKDTVDVEVLTSSRPVSDDQQPDD